MIRISRLNLSLHYKLSQFYGGRIMKKTKIICTMGPNTSDKNVMMELARNGMDVARFNFSRS